MADLAEQPHQLTAFDRPAFEPAAALAPRAAPTEHDCRRQTGALGGPVYCGALRRRQADRDMCGAGPSLTAVAHGETRRCERIGIKQVCAG